MLTRLFVLGLLTWRPLSGYEIHFILQQNQTERWAGILPGSIYHALKKLADEGFVVLQATEQVGNRAKAIYAITSAGEEEFRRLLKETWRVPLLHFPSGIYTALGFVDSLPRVKAQYIPEAMLEYQRALFANGREHLEIDLRFLRYLRETLPSVPRLSLTLPPVPLEEENP